MPPQILSGAAIRLNPRIFPPGPMLSILKVLGRYFPKITLPDDGVSGESWDEAFGTPELGALGRTDPLVAYGVPVRAGSAAAVFRELARVDEEMAGLRARNLLVLHNERDGRTDFSAARELFDGADCDGVKELYEPGGGAHQLLQETPDITAKVIEKIVGFVERVCYAEGIAVGEEGAASLQETDGN